MEQFEETVLREKVATAEAIQRMMASKVELCRLRRRVLTIAAVDADYDEVNVYAAAVLFRYDSCTEPLEQRTVVQRVTFPYLPGYLSLREAPALWGALRGLSQAPDVVLVDGQGVAHPRRFGLACHIGVLAGIPTIGCAKTHLAGTFTEPGAERGEWSLMELDGAVVGAALRTRTAVKPVFVSPGHLITLEEAIGIVLHCSTQYRTPEPLRMADHVARGLRGARRDGGPAEET